jgi:N-acetylglucosaminyl-diphospho-decaprenol L-rhamnosyltransferase
MERSLRNGARGPHRQHDAGDRGTRGGYATLLAMGARTIDVVIPVHGGWAHTERCLAHLAEQTAPHTVVLVDNASPDDTLARARIAFPSVRVVEMGVNAGFARAVNRGVVVGTGDVIVALNNDVDLAPDCLAALAGAFDDDRVGSAAPLLLGRDGARIDAYGVAVDRTLAGFVRLHGQPPAAVDREDGALPLLGPYGAAAAYRRSAYEALAGLDERIFMYGEELDLALRMTAAHWRCAGVPNARGVHVGGATAGKRSGWQRYRGGFARGYLLRRYGVLRSPAALRALVTEAIVVAGDLAASRDVEALRGRVHGWRAAHGLRRHPMPPTAPLGFIASLRLRINGYGD